MAKFGKKNKVSTNITDYNVCVLGLSGIGKTTLMKETCEKLVGEDGYIIFNMGKEDGVSCIDGIIYENIENWKKLQEVCKDIIQNKETDYPDLKIIVIDTIDQMFELAETQVIAMYNAEKAGEKNFKKCTSINAAYGGYGSGLDKSCQIVLDMIWALKKAGLAVWMCGHTKNKDIVDPLTDQTYTTISANLSQKYFNAIKTKMDVVGMAVIDRDIVTESTGRKDINNKEITKNKIVSEARKIIFRDDNYGVDSKSRFRHIVEEIPLDTDSFIKAIKDAIEKAKNTPDEKESPVKEIIVEEEVVEETPVKEPVKETPVEESADLFNEVSDEPEEIPIETLRKGVASAVRKIKDEDKKNQIREFVANNGGKVPNLSREALEELLELCNS